MLFLTLSAVGLLVGPEPDLRRMIKSRDYPNEMVRAEKSVFAEIAVIIDPEGYIEQCDLLSFIGDERFANRVCGLLDKRMWKRSLDADGRPIYALNRTEIRFSVPSTTMGRRVQNAKASPDLDLRLPESWNEGSSEVDVPIAVLVGEDGYVEACRFQPAPLTKRDAEKLAPLACESITQQSFGPINTTGGTVQRYVVMQDVRFSLPEN